MPRVTTVMCDRMGCDSRYNISELEEDNYSPPGWIVEVQMTLVPPAWDMDDVHLSGDFCSPECLMEYVKISIEALPAVKVLLEQAADSKLKQLHPVP